MPASHPDHFTDEETEPQRRRRLAIIVIQQITGGKFTGEEPGAEARGEMGKEAGSLAPAPKRGLPLSQGLESLALCPRHGFLRSLGR